MLDCNVCEYASTCPEYNPDSDCSLTQNDYDLKFLEMDIPDPDWMEEEA